MKKTTVESDINRMQSMYKGLGLMSEDASAGGSVEGDIAKLQKRNKSLRESTKTVRSKPFPQGAIDFAMGLLRGRK